MALPAIDSLCKALERFPPNDLCVLLPGGAQVCAQLTELPPSLFQQAKGLIGAANAALAPLQPLFDIVEAITAIQKCVQAIPDALGPPPDPSKLAQCVPNLVEKVEKLIALLPPASILAMVAQLLDAIIALLQGTVFELQAIQALLARIAAAQELSGQVPTLLQVIDCGNQSAASSLDNLSRALASVNPIIGLINSFGLVHVPELDASIMADGPQPAIDALGDVVRVLSSIRDTIPL